MFCDKCGNELNEGASFCPKCGNKIEANMAAEASVPSQSKRKNKWRIVLMVAIVFLIIVFFYRTVINKKEGASVTNMTTVGTSNKTEKKDKKEEETLPNWVQNNKDKGATNPKDIIDAYMNALAEHDSKYIAKYWDAAAGASDRGCELYMSNNIDDYLYEHILELNNIGCSQLYLKAGYDYTIDEDTPRKLYSVKSFKVDFYDKGLIGKGSGYTTYLYFHSNLTPDGIRWFVGKAKRYQDLPGSYYDPTGLQ